jgi:hypothetical protein
MQGRQEPARVVERGQRPRGRTALFSRVLGTEAPLNRQGPGSLAACSLARIQKLTPYQSAAHAATRCARRFFLVRPAAAGYRPCCFCGRDGEAPRQGLKESVGWHLSAAKRHRAGAVLPNPSVKPSANGGPRGPGWRYAVHFRHPGPRVPPLSPAYLERYALRAPVPACSPLRTHSSAAVRLYRSSVTVERHFAPSVQTRFPRRELRRAWQQHAPPSGFARWLAV